MTSSESHLRVLRELEETPDITQRELARRLGVSLGAINYCLKALVEKGWVKMEGFGRNENKLRYAYLLTPRGITAKTRLTSLFLKRKLREYEALKVEIEALQREVGP
ncbi:MarR family EPS-associated transcriptional regulator [Seongchinamella sediminis]|uniref:MarR family EPS-associated transcriptional regulator n=1 Tax=Seongchinamella sediminis TaxID=2283635 RepID=A0A3L7DVP7_9GAMM|nr:MarR family EPS-associated transcriptional regulator [Seongchinamella sediminis]RLQ21186.1 MarR family EPS-associated transcriptional regulator [Seongchinamella sediminis]